MLAPIAGDFFNRLLLTWMNIYVCMDHGLLLPMTKYIFKYMCGNLNVCYTTVSFNNLQVVRDSRQARKNVPQTIARMERQAYNL